MKRIGGLFDQISDRRNLVFAYWRAARGKRARREVREFETSADDQLNEIAGQLRSGDFQFESYRPFVVRDTKRRTIHAPTFRDRVVHHAIIAVTGPVLESGAIRHSYACRQGRGHHAAIKQAAIWTRRKLWYGKIDVHKFYDSIDHEVLRKLLARRFSEKRLLGLFDRLLASYAYAPGGGLPIGALTSQYLGNFYLDEFDRRMKASRIVPRYLRYMDDLFVWYRQVQLQSIRDMALENLDLLRLKAKNGGQWNRCACGVPMLGFVVYPDRIRVNRNGRKRLRVKLSAVQRAANQGLMTELDLQQRATSLFAHVRHADDVRWRRTVVSFSRNDDRCGDTLER